MQFSSVQFSSVQFSSVQFIQFSSVQPSSVHGAGQPVRTTAPPKAWSFCQSNPLGSQAGSYPRDTRASSRSTGPLTGPANVQRWIGVSPPVLINPKVLKSGWAMLNPRPKLRWGAHHMHMLPAGKPTIATAGGLPPPGAVARCSTACWRAQGTGPAEQAAVSSVEQPRCRARHPTTSPARAAPLQPGCAHVYPAMPSSQTHNSPLAIVCSMAPRRTAPPLCSCSQRRRRQQPALGCARPS